MVEKRQKCHYFGNSRSWRALRLAVVAITGTCRDPFTWSGCLSPFLFFLKNPVKSNFNVSSLKGEKKKAAGYLLRPKSVVAILPTGFEESHMYEVYTTNVRNANDANVVFLIVSIVKEQIGEIEEDSFHCFVNKGRRASACRSEILVCFPD